MIKHAPVLCLLLAACSQNSVDMAAYYRAEGDRLEEETRHVRLAYTFEDFIANPEYRHTRDMWRGAALEQYAPKKSHVEFLLEEQRGRLYINGIIAMDFPICSGRVGGMETPVGTFRISQKEELRRSNRYGVFLSKEDGSVIERGVAVTDALPEGAYFEGADMPYWMRFNGAIGMHVGKVHRDTDSHGCVRVPEEAAAILFEKLGIGSKVIVK
ncbi:MAG: L,D-transpeptidase [Akkermansia sp.]|nr:L,D-transpeptidase [Akkermansia sp.]